jgi:hypothetical protein
VIATVALFTSTSHQPHEASTYSIMAWYSARLLTSAATAIADPPAAWMSATIFPAGSGV